MGFTKGEVQASKCATGAGGPAWLEMKDGVNENTYCSNPACQTHNPVGGSMVGNLNFQCLALVVLTKIRDKS